MSNDFKNVYIEASNSQGFPIKYIPAPGTDPEIGISLKELLSKDIPEDTVRLQLKQLWGDEAQYSDLGNTAYENVVFIGETVLPASEVIVRDTSPSSQVQENAKNDFPPITCSKKHPDSTHVLVFNKNVIGKPHKDYALLDDTTIVVNQKHEVIYQKNEI